MYLSLSADLGLIYDTAFILAARLRGRPVIIHHHSFGCLDTPNALARIAIRAAGSSACHITLCGRMASQLRKGYGVRRTIVVSNRALLSRTQSCLAEPRTSMSTLGFLSNVTAEKGIDTFIKLIDELRRRGVSVRGAVAGPIVDGSAAAIVNEARARGDVDYFGPLYGQAKQTFWDRIDVLVFPTRYKNEAEPLVILEALEAGIPVVSRDLGCIRDMVNDGAGLVIDKSDCFERSATALLDRWWREPCQYAQATANVRTQLTVGSKNATGERERFRAELAELLALCSA
jgi:glycosyltransferase involved in cell wall biosynthesis